MCNEIFYVSAIYEIVGVRYRNQRCICNGLCGVPHHAPDKVTFPEYLITYLLEVGLFVVVNRDEYHPVMPEQVSRHEEARVNHAAPVGMNAAVRHCVLDDPKALAVGAALGA